MVDILPTVEGDQRPIEVQPVALFDLTGAYAGAGAATPAGNNTPTVVDVTNAGSTTAGAVAFTIANTGAANGTVAGTPLEPGQSVSAESTNGLDALAYDATGTTFKIIEVN